MTTQLPTAEMQRAYLERDAKYNGLFFLGVRTTGIFCRPTCPARKPLPKNVEYFSTAREALVAGYRPCKRCRPIEVDEQPAWAAALMAEVERDPAVRIAEGDLRTRGIDPATVRRYFQKEYGMTFQAFARAFGAAPGSYRGGEAVFLAWIRSPLGPLVAGATAEGLCLLEFSDRRMLETQFATLRQLIGAPAVPGSNAHLELLERELAAYFAGTLERFTVPLVYPGTQFHRQVWEQLLAIPYGQTRSYQQLASELGNPKAVRAVGRANGLNRIAIVIPCHRVINKDGGLGGYGGGLRRKQYLLDLERKRAGG